MVERVVTNRVDTTLTTSAAFTANKIFVAYEDGANKQTGWVAWGCYVLITA